MKLSEIIFRSSCFVGIRLQKQRSIPVALALIFMLHFTNIKAIAQGYPNHDFISPLQIPFYLSGVFGECRPTHFHAGMDIKTNQVEGLPVICIGDGYVSRIKVSAYGYGNALYITHPNGYTSVYGHLQSYAKPIADYVKQKQFEKQSFEIDEYLPLNMITFRQGEQIAKSGNTGGSGGPHLHFEIRDSFENALNPQLFGIKVIDHISPAISGLAIFNMDKDRFISGPIIVNCKNKEDHYVPTKDTILLNSESVAFAIETHDKMDGAAGNNGVYNIDLSIDGIHYFNYTMDKFHFDETRNVVGYVNQPLRESTNRNFQQCFVLPNQSFNCFKQWLHRGIFSFSDTAYHLVNIEVKDFQNNSTSLRFYVKNDNRVVAFKKQETDYYRVIYPFKSYTYSNDEIKVIIPGTAFFDTTYINYAKIPGTKYSSIYQFGKPTDDLYTPIEFGIKANNLSAELKEKALLVNKSGGGNVSCGGRYEDVYIIGKTKSLGSFVINIDTIAPMLKPVNLLNDKVMSKETYIKFLLSDNLSGVGKYAGYIDGQWVLFEFDAKNALLKYAIDLPHELKSHELVIKVEDERKNSKSYVYRFVY